MAYLIGDIAHLTAAFRTVPDGIPADPDTVTLRIQAPDGSQTSYSVVPNEIIRTGIGDYYFDLDIDQAGPNSIDPAYLYQWRGDGTLDSVQEGYIVVAPTSLVPQPPPAPPTFTAAQLADLNAMIAAGVIRMRFQDREYEYRSMSELLQARNVMLATLQGNTMNRQVRMITAKGV